MNNKLLTTPMVAFYWYDLDSSWIWNSNYDYDGDYGRLYYHIYDSQDTSTLSKINELVALRRGTNQFKAAWALVATWDRVRPWPNWWYTQEVRLLFIRLL